MIEIIPLKKLDAEINIPGSKYIANRVLLLAALSDGKSFIENVPDNEDINNSVEALRSFGVKIEKNLDKLLIYGTKGNLSVPGNKINVGDSGTLLRFIAAASALAEGKVEICGSKRLNERPIIPLLSSLEDLGITSKSTAGFSPITIVGGTLRGGTTMIKGDISSQFISALLMIAPFAKNDVEIILETELVSKEYVDMTISLMHEFCVYIKRTGYRRFMIKSGQRYVARDYIVPCDWSIASYFLAAAAIVPGTVKIKNVDFSSFQGEKKFSDILVEMGCISRRTSSTLQIIGTPNLVGVDIDMSAMPDVVQTLAAVAAVSEGKTVIRNISNLKFKESDRINDTAYELRKLGTKASTTEDSLIITGGKIHSAIIDPHNDHRMVMSFALLGLKFPGIKLKDQECANKSYPGFWDKLKEIGAVVKNVR